MNKSVLVVGTTADYIQHLDKTSVHSLIFLTDKSERESAKEASPKKNIEILCNISNFEKSFEALNTYIHENDISLCGITCFDCESMEISSFIASKIGVYFESIDTIKMCRSKFLSKEIWLKNGLNTPKVKETNDINSAEDFFLSLCSDGDHYCVIKPISGAGSELVSLSKNLEELKYKFLFTQRELEKRSANRLYSSDLLDNTKLILEEYIDGTEYSCDFFVEKGEIAIIRLCEKIKTEEKFFGIINGYKIIHAIPNISHTKIINTLKKASTSLGIKKSICMIDFIISKNKIYLIEIAPRPGGDCLPQLIKKSSGQDILSLNIKATYSSSLVFKDYRKIKPLIAIRIFAHSSGILKEINYSKLKSNKKVLEFNITARSNKIELPPNDYDSWILGNIILDQEDISQDEIKNFLDLIHVSIS